MTQWPSSVLLKDYLNALKKVLLIDDEPMMNIAGFYEERKWRLVIFPRRKHRPDVFFKDGDARMVVSPGVIDMGGLLITPVEKRFRTAGCECCGEYLQGSIPGPKDRGKGDRRNALMEPPAGKPPWSHSTAPVGRHPGQKMPHFSAAKTLVSCCLDEKQD